MQNPQIASALVKANKSEFLSNEEELQIRCLADELFILVAVGATETEKWSSIDRNSIDFEYLRLVFKENPGLIEYWDRYRPVGVAVSQGYVEAVDGLIREMRNDS